MIDSVHIKRTCEEWNLETHRLGRHVWVFDRLESTNTLALELARDAANDGLVVLAREQTSGRGQHGRTWQAPAKSSVLLSALLFPPPEARGPALLTAWAAVSVRRLLGNVIGETATIKWPNDILLGRKKVCGILIEQRTIGQQLATVAGIGLNVNQDEDGFAAAALPDATSLLIQTGKRHDWQTVARQLIHCLDDAYEAIHQGRTESLLADWRAGLGLLGRHVVVETHDRNLIGRLHGLTFASLELELPTGELLRLVPESVKHLHVSQAAG
jgi:BirA family biotin operon repressor/biotin-[acetyl-CoA-carboxylase] ligase